MKNQIILFRLRFVFASIVKKFLEIWSKHKTWIIIFGIAILGVMQFGLLLAQEEDRSRLLQVYGTIFGHLVGVGIALFSVALLVLSRSVDPQRKFLLQRYRKIRLKREEYQGICERIRISWTTQHRR